MIDSERDSTLTVQVDKTLATVTLARPAALNAFDTELQHAMRTAVDHLSADEHVRCILITGAGRAFSAGADIALDDLSDDVRLAPRTEEELRMRYNPMIRAIRMAPKPVVAAVNGAAVGVGCALALACDQIIAAESATFSVAFSKVGLTLDAGASILLGARVGLGRASRMALLSERVPSRTALDWGMVDAVVDDEHLSTEATTLARELAAGPTRAFAATKASLNTALLGELDAAFEAEIQGQTRLVDSADFREGARAFGERRRPAFTGE
ncbi:MAG: enoyl-CoA hydratase-related protein [Gordonia sp. (in: high G+C Gram-positive bacteria)]|uniref:enoyl-CoA hydratase-related protein n=1 Tax=Gordonia sp. (in: high G+C Gram-positive bacteria) TaxID=84139 RepID=UPI003BB5BA22